MLLLARLRRYHQKYHHNQFDEEQFGNGKRQLKVQRRLEGDEETVEVSRQQRIIWRQQSKKMWWHHNRNSSGTNVIIVVQVLLVLFIYKCGKFSTLHNANLFVWLWLKHVVSLVVVVVVIVWGGNDAKHYLHLPLFNQIYQVWCVKT